MLVDQLLQILLICFMDRFSLNQVKTVNLNTEIKES